MEGNFFRSILLESEGKIDKPLSYNALLGLDGLNKSTVTVTSPGTPIVAINSPAKIIYFMYDNEDSNAHHFDIYDGTNKIYRINMPANSSDIIQIKLPISDSLRIDSDSDLPTLTVVYY